MSGYASDTDAALAIAEFHAQCQRRTVVQVCKRSVDEISRERPTPLQRRALAAFQVALMVAKDAERKAKPEYTAEWLEGELREFEARYAIASSVFYQAYEDGKVPEFVSAFDRVVWADLYREARRLAEARPSSSPETPPNPARRADK